jgi:hypothetical protein
MSQSRHQARITETKESGFYCLIVRIDRDGEENVIYGYKGRYLKTRKAAEKSTATFIKKHC